MAHAASPKLGRDPIAAREDLPRNNQCSGRGWHMVVLGRRWRSLAGGLCRFLESGVSSIISAYPSIPEWDVPAPEPTCSRTKRAMTVYWTMLTPTTAAGAVGAVRLIAGSAGELNGSSQALGLASPARGIPRIGDVRLCDLLSIDRGCRALQRSLCGSLPARRAARAAATA